MSESFVPLGDLPGYVRDEICIALDSSAEHSWVRLIKNIPDRDTYKDLLELRSLADRRLSPSEELWRNLSSQGWDVVSLGRVAQKADLGRVVDIISEYCRDEGIEVNLHENPPSEEHQFAAKSCLTRSRYPTEIEPSMEAMQEAKRRYNLPDSPAPPPYSKVEHDRGQGSANALPGPKDNCEVTLINATPICTTIGQATPTSNCVNSSASGTVSPSVRVDMPTSSAAGSSNTTSTSTSTSASFRGSLSPPANLEEVRYDVILKATEHFDRKPYKDGGHKVGDGGFGEVFQCWLSLRSGRVHTAVKVLLNKSNSSSAENVDSVDRKQFSTEIQALSKLSHKCLLPVLGYSHDGPHLCLIYPFMRNGSLEPHLSDHTSLPPPARLALAIDIAEGLDYLHVKAENTIIHRDIKSANVLLTEDWRGRLGDFGLARLLSSQQSTSSIIHTTTIVGTRVYMAPETAHGKISSKADVYSLGVVLLELLTGKCALSNILNTDGEETDLVTYVEELDDGEEMVLNVGGWGPDLWEKLWSLARLCLQRLQRRPLSTKVLQELVKLQ